MSGCFYNIKLTRTLIVSERETDCGRVAVDRCEHKLSDAGFVWCAMARPGAPGRVDLDMTAK